MLTIKESIDILKNIQELDRELYLALRKSEEIPEQKAVLKQQLEAEKAHLHQLEADYKKLQLKQKEKDGELSQKEANVKKLDGQLASVKTNKEYSALQQEIASLKADGALLEEEIIKVMDSVEAADEEVKKERERLKVIEKDYAGKEAELDKQIKAHQEAIEGLKKKRDEMVHSVPPDVFGLYDLIVKKKQGIGLIKVNGETCGACQIKMRPQLLNEVRMYQALVTCENCSRILYVED